MSLSPLVLQASSLAGAVADLEASRRTIVEDKASLESQASALEDEIRAVKARISQLDKAVAFGEADVADLKDKIRQGAQAKLKIEEGMVALLETLEREEMLLKQRADG